MSDAKSYLRVDGADEDVLIGSLITAAREFAEGYQNRDFETDPPGDLEKVAMLMLIGHLYEHREAVNVGNITSEVPFGVKSCLNINRTVPL